MPPRASAAEQVGETPAKPAAAKPAAAKPARAAAAQPSTPPVSSSTSGVRTPAAPTRATSGSRTSSLGEAWWTTPRAPEAPASGDRAGSPTRNSVPSRDQELTEPVDGARASTGRRGPKIAGLTGAKKRPGAASSARTTRTDPGATEPIARPGTAGKPSKPGKPSNPGPGVTEPIAQPGKANPGASRPATGTAASWRIRAGDARRELKQATRSRRRYERDESRRFTQRSRRRRLAWLISGGAVVGLVLIVLLAAYSPLLAVRAVAIEGTSRVDVTAVTNALDDQVGRPLALVDYGAIERDLAQFPMIESYSVEARPPDILAIRVVERRPVAQVQTATGFDLLDAAGVTVQQATERIPGFPVLDLTGTQIGSPGFDAAAAVLTSLPDTLLSQVDRISGTTPDSVTLVFGGVGQRVVWGSPEDSELKAVILQRLIATQDPARAVEYDVSSPQSPVVR